jgi:hypothetical protein
MSSNISFLNAACFSNGRSVICSFPSGVAYFAATTSKSGATLATNSAGAISPAKTPVSPGKASSRSAYPFAPDSSQARMMCVIGSLPVAGFLTIVRTQVTLPLRQVFRPPFRSACRDRLVWEREGSRQGRIAPAVPPAEAPVFHAIPRNALAVFLPSRGDQSRPIVAWLTPNVRAISVSGSPASQQTPQFTRTGLDCEHRLIHHREVAGLARRIIVGRMGYDS